MEEYRNEQLKKYSGVRSWLLVLCIVLTLGIPIKTLYNLIIMYQDSHKYFQLLPNLAIYFYIDIVLSLIIIVLSIRAGIALWTIKPRAVKTAKNYLFLYLCYAVISLFLPIIVGIYTKINEALIIEIILSGLQALIFFSICYVYLNVSNRVKVTYT